MHTYCYLLPFSIIFISYTTLHHRCPLYRVTPVFHVTHTRRKIPRITAKTVKSAIERLETPDITSLPRPRQPVTRITRLADITPTPVAIRHPRVERTPDTLATRLKLKGRQVAPPPSRNRLTSLYRRIKRTDVDVAGLTGVLCSDLEEG